MCDVIHLDEGNPKLRAEAHRTLLRMGYRPISPLTLLVKRLYGPETKECRKTGLEVKLAAFPNPYR